MLLTGASLVAAGTVNRYQLPLILVMAFAAFLPVMNVAVVARNLNQVAAAARRCWSWTSPCSCWSTRARLRDQCRPSSSSMP